MSRDDADADADLDTDVDSDVHAAKAPSGAQAAPLRPAEAERADSEHASTARTIRSASPASLCSTTASASLGDSDSRFAARLASDVAALRNDRLTADMLNRPEERDSNSRSGSAQSDSGLAKQTAQDSATSR